MRHHLILLVALVAATTPARAQHSFGPPELATPIAAAADGATAAPSSTPSVTASVTLATPDTAMLVTVHNEMFADAAIYLVHNSTPQGRVATITGHDHGTFALSRAQALAGGDVSFLVRFIGGGQRPLQTDAIQPTAGDHYTITIGPQPTVTFTSMADGAVEHEPPNIMPASVASDRARGRCRDFALSLCS